MASSGPWDDQCLSKAVKNEWKRGYTWRHCLSFVPWLRPQSTLLSDKDNSHTYLTALVWGFNEINAL